jgi:pterin-4a-carbinolamine dehydratase
MLVIAISYLIGVIFLTTIIMKASEIKHNPKSHIHIKRKNKKK